MRIASYSQLSQRYAKVQTNEEWFVEPDSIKHSTYRLGYLEFMEYTAKLYNAMCEDGIPNEDARMVLPNACFTSIMVSMNARSLVEQCSKRNTLDEYTLSNLQEYLPKMVNKKIHSSFSKNILSDKLRKLFNIFDCSRKRHKPYWSRKRNEWEYVNTPFRLLSKTNRLEVLSLLK